MLVSISSAIPCFLPLATIKSDSNTDVFLNDLEFFTSKNLELLRLLVSKTSVEYSEEATRGLLYKKVLLKIPEILQENTCVGVNLFSVKFAKFLRAPILKNICKRLLLNSTMRMSFLTDMTLMYFSTSFRQFQKNYFKKYIRSVF